MINTIHSSCKDCVFANYSNNTQIGCHLNYLNRYKEKNIEILEVFDDEKEFFVINDRKCLGHKNQNWFNTIGMMNSTLQEKIDRFNELNKLSYLLVIDLKDLSNDDLTKIIQNLNDTNIKPLKIIFIKYPEKFSFSDIDQQIKKLHFEVVWTVQDMLDLSVSHEQTIHTIISTHKKYNFLCVMKKYNNINDFVLKVNELIFKDLEVFSLAKNTDQTCYIFNTLVYRYALFIEKVDIFTDHSNHIII